MLSRKPSLSSPLVVALLLFGAGSASAFSISHTTNYDGSALQISDTVTVHLFIDTEGAGDPGTSPGLSALGIGVLFTSPELEYVPGALSSPNPFAYLNYYAPGYPLPTY